MPDLTSEASIRQGLQTRYIGQKIYYWAEIGSTNDALKQLADEGAPEGSLAFSQYQSTGRGRLDRGWFAPPDSSLLASLLFRPRFLKPSNAAQITMVCSLAAADAVNELTGLQAAVKWPNDLLLNGKKLAGVLTELGFDPGQAKAEQAAPSMADRSNSSPILLAWIVVGIGINVNINLEDWPPDLASTAISLSSVLGRSVSRRALLQHYLALVELRYEALRAGHSPHQEWASRLTTLGQPVTVAAPEASYQGVVEGVDALGRLLVRQADEQLVTIISGDVALDGSMAPGE